MYNCLRLHLGNDGKVWFGDDQHIAVAAAACESPAEFFRRHTGKVLAAKTVRLLGSAGNAPLVEALYDHRVVMKTSAMYPTVQLGSPLIARRPASSPAEVLGMIWHACASADALGQWLPLSDYDYAAYTLTSAVQQAGGVICDKARQILPYHPAWPAFSFPMPAGDLDACCLVAAAIVDPRWFHHPTHPGRPSRLYAHFGLTPDNAQCLSAGNNRHCNVARAAAKAWLGFDPALDATAGIAVDLQQPRAFLRRVFATADRRAAGLMLATRRFLLLVRDVWISERSDGNCAFDPEMFFNSEAEIAAYKAHRKALAPAPVPFLLT